MKFYAESDDLRTGEGMLEFVYALMTRGLEPSFVTVEDEVGVIERIVSDPNVNATYSILEALLNLQNNPTGFRWVSFKAVDRQSGKKFFFKVLWDGVKHQYLVEEGT